MSDKKKTKADAEPGIDPETGHPVMPPADIDGDGDEEQIVYPGAHANPPTPPPPTDTEGDGQGVENVEVRRLDEHPKKSK